MKGIAIHINDKGIGGYLLALVREQQKVALSYQELVTPEKKDALFTNRKMHKRTKDKIYYRNVYSPLTYAQVYNNFKKNCEEFNIRDENGKFTSFTTHQFRHNGITDRLRAGFTLAQIAEMTGHHGSAMIYGSYAHLDLIPVQITESRKYSIGEQSGDNPYVMFGRKILNMDAVTESRLMRNLRSHMVPGGICIDITHCKNDMWNCLECKRFVPEKEQLPYFKEQVKAWREKSEKFRNNAIMCENFKCITDRFIDIIKKIKEETGEANV